MIWLLIVGEIGARYLVSSGDLPNRLPADLFTEHPVGWTLEPNITVQIPSGYGNIEIKTNDDGFRDQAYSRQATSSTTRIALIGDSFVLGIESPFQDLFHVRLEENAPEWQVMAFGASAYGLSQYNLVYDDVVRPYAPDMVLAMVYVGNDFIDEPFLREQQFPHYNLQPDGNLHLFNYPYQGEFNPPLFKIQRSSPLMRRSAFAFLVGTVLRHRQDERIIDQGGGECAYFMRAFFQQPTEEEWRLGEALILRLRDQVEASGSQFALVLLPTEYQVAPTVQTDFAAECGPVPSSWEPPQQRLIPFLQAEQVLFLDMLPALQTAEADGPLYFPSTDIHWTAAGHHAVYQALSAWLAENLAP